MLVKKKYTLKEIKEASLFLLPLFTFILLFIFIPVVGTFITSLFKDVSFLEKEFILFSNYQRLISDSQFRQAFRFTLLFISVSVFLEIVLGLLLALILNQKIPLRGVLRACILIPWVVPAAVSARTWELIYNYHYGLANFLQIFYKVTLPLQPIIVVALLFRTIDALRIFDLIYVLTGGGPGGATASLSLYAYKYFLSGDFGYGSAISVILFVIAFLFSLFYVKSGRFTEQVFL